MKQSYKTGFSFGLTSAIITTLGLMVGLHAGTHSKMVVLGGILTIAVADAFSDALGIHVSEEAKDGNTPRTIWEATVSTFFFKFVFALTFAVPVLIFSLSTAIIVSIVYGLLLLGVLSFYFSKLEHVRPWMIVSEHLTIALLVILATHALGDWIGKIFQ